MAMVKCYLCEKGILEKKKVPYELVGEFIGNFDAEICPKCKEVFFDEETSRMISAATKEKGLWGLGARTKIGQAGSTLDIRLPKRIIDLLKLKKGEDIMIYPDTKKRLIVELT